MSVEKRNGFIKRLIESFMSKTSTMKEFVHFYHVIIDQENYDKIYNLVSKFSCIFHDQLIDYDKFVTMIREENFTIDIGHILTNQRDVIANEFEDFYFHWVHPDTITRVKVSRTTLTKEESDRICMILMEKFYDRIRGQDDFCALFGYNIEYEQYKKLSSACTHYFIPYDRKSINCNNFVSYLKMQDFIVSNIQAPQKERAMFCSDFRLFCQHHQLC